MSWRARGISMFRQAFNGTLKKNMKPSTVPIANSKGNRALTSCCIPEPKSKFDNCTVPEGCWQQAYDEMMASDTKVLIGGAALFVVSLFVLRAVGTFPTAPEFDFLQVFFSKPEKNSDF